MTRYSGLSTATKIWALVALAAIMLVVWWVAHQLFHNWLPIEIVGYVVVGMFCLFVGIIIGEKSTLKAIEKNRSSSTPTRFE